MKTARIEEVYNKDYIFVDVRSPKEFAEDRIPGAINIPLFDNEERAIVGTLYTKESKEKAIDEGLKIFSEKLPKMVKEYKKLKKAIVVYCWRGGMRSHAIVSLFHSIGYDVTQLEKGYKDYRRFVRVNLTKVKVPPLVLIYGLTGTGKTDLLQEFENSLDLEGLANHRGSVFGDINLQPHTQKMFESLLYKRLLELQKEKVVITEGESRKIGKVSIPDSVWQAMKKGRNVKLIAPIQERVDRIHRIYFQNFDKNIFIEKIRFIEKYIGKKKVEEMIELLKAGKNKEWIQMTLEEYYDRLYAHTVDNREYIGKIRTKKNLLRTLEPK